MESPLDYQQWDQLSYNKHALTIKDIINLKKGQQIKVLTMDRNVWDCLTDCTKGQSYPPEELLADSWAIYIHEENLRGKLVFWFECENDQIEFTNELDQSDFEFHVEYEKGNWYPLKQGYLPANDPQGYSFFPWTEKKYWTEFDQMTPVGWRGHMILWSKLEEMPDIYY